jgi:cancer susceptibility candidate protein 1
LHRPCCFVLQRADEYADPKGDVLLTAQQGVLQWGLWVNTQKNPRFKSVEMSGLGIAVEIPKQLALANIGLRIQVGRCSTKWWQVLQAGLVAKQ